MDLKKIQKKYDELHVLTIEKPWLYRSRVMSIIYGAINQSSIIGYDVKDFLKSINIPPTHSFSFFLRNRNGQHFDWNIFDWKSLLVCVQSNFYIWILIFLMVRHVIVIINLCFRNPVFVVNILLKIF